MYDELIAELRQHHCDAKEDDTQEVCEECCYDVIIVDKSAPSGFASVCACGLMNRAADAIEELSAVLDKFPRWIPVTERLPETGVDVLVKFPQNMAVASIDIGEWVVNSGDGWCTDINLAGGEKNPTHWMPLPQPPEEGE